jgi:hypothetical protein
MDPAHRPRWGLWLPAGVLLAVFLLQTLPAIGLKSPTFDETGDIAAGLSYLQTGTVWLNLQHPPLLKELSAVLLWIGGVRLPAEAQQQGRERDAGSALIQANGPDRVMWLARLPLVAVALMLGVVLFMWGRELLGERAALCAVFIYVLDPNIVAHSYLATTDVGFAAFAMLFLFTLWRYLKQPDLKHVVICGVTLGLALASKFSAVFLVPIAVVLVVAGGRKMADAARDLLLMGLAALIVVQIFYFSPAGPFLYKAGMEQVNRDHNPNYNVFMGGEFDHRFASYFAVTWLLKEPLAATLAAAVGLWFVLRGKDVDRRAKLFLLLPPSVLFLAYTIWADDLGIRYLLPVLPFAFLLGGAGLARMPRAAAVALAAWMVIAAAGIWPDHLSYFNEAACLLREPAKVGLDGGSKCGIYWLDDSNIDWGQGYKQLKTWMDQHGAGRTIRLQGFSSFPARAYGFPMEEVGFGQVPAKPGPGLWGVSAHTVARAPGTWLQTTPPVAVVGHAIYIYDIP